MGRYQRSLQWPIGRKKVELVFWKVVGVTLMFLQICRVIDAGNVFHMREDEQVVLFPTGLRKWPAALQMQMSTALTFTPRHKLGDGGQKS